MLYRKANLRTFRIPTAQKFRTLFRIWDIQRVGYLTPGILVSIMRDVYDILGRLSVDDYQKEAIQLFQRIDSDKDCRCVRAVHGGSEAHKMRERKK